jgi:dihydroneopterin aldolase
MQQDTIFIQELKTTATIGIQAWEKEMKQPIVLDLVITTDITQAAAHDDIRHAIDYKQVCDMVSSLVENSNFELIESLATAIADLILKKFDAQKIKVTLYKPIAVPQAKTVGVCIERTKPSSANAL